VQNLEVDGMKINTPIQTFLGRGIFCLLLLLAQQAHSAPKTILVLGDSLSAEYGIKRGSGWVALLEQRLKDQKIDAQVMNASISGETTRGGKTRIAALLNKYKPNIVMVELGGNDALRGFPIADSKSNLQDIIQQAKSAKAKVLLIGMQIPPNYGLDYTQQFERMYANLANTNKIPLLPFLLDKVVDDPTLFQADQIHPKEAAQGLMLENVWPHLKPLL
jgi:acyl-CoA thioesterase-1